MKINLYITNTVDFLSGKSPKISGFDMNDVYIPDEWMKIGETEVFPEKFTDKMRATGLESIQKLKDELRVQHNQKMIQLEEQENKLLALEHLK